MSNCLSFKRCVNSIQSGDCSCHFEPDALDKCFCVISPWTLSWPMPCHRFPQHSDEGSHWQAVHELFEFLSDREKEKDRERERKSERYRETGACPSLVFAWMEVFLLFSHETTEWIQQSKQAVVDFALYTWLLER